MSSTKAGRAPGFLQGISLLMPITLSVMAALFVAPMAPKMAEHFIRANPAKAADIGWYIEWIITVPSLCVALFSPFAGIGSEGHVALTFGRRFVGTELKRAYFDRAKINLSDAIRRRHEHDSQGDLFGASSAMTFQQVKSDV